MLKRITVLIVAVMFALVSLPAMAGPPQWGVIKDKKGKCKVIQIVTFQSEKGPLTPKTVAGPFATKDEAYKAMKETCPPAEKKK
jgi:hypothetical protein